MASVAIREVRKSFGAAEVIHGVDIAIDDGEFVVLVGPSGCGKSTLLRMIAGLENITAGEIRIGERVAMGRAIVRDPQVFLFDEPLSNLDAKLRVQMRTEIKELHQRLKTTTIYVTHDHAEGQSEARREACRRGRRRRFAVRRQPAGFRRTGGDLWRAARAHRTG